MISYTRNPAYLPAYSNTRNLAHLQAYFNPPVVIAPRVPQPLFPQPLLPIPVPSPPIVGIVTLSRSLTHEIHLRPPRNRYLQRDANNVNNVVKKSFSKSTQDRNENLSRYTWATFTRVCCAEVRGGIHDTNLHPIMNPNGCGAAYW